MTDESSPPADNARLDAIEKSLEKIVVILQAMTDMLRSSLSLPARGAPYRVSGSGTVRPPADLGPAIAALGAEARERMYTILGDRPVTPEAIAQAADWEHANRRVSAA